MISELAHRLDYRPDCLGHERFWLKSHQDGSSKSASCSEARKTTAMDEMEVDSRDGDIYVSQAFIGRTPVSLESSLTDIRPVEDHRFVSP